MSDFVVLQQIKDREAKGEVVEFRTKTMLNTICLQPRILDKPPKRISLKKLDNPNRYGCREIFIATYSHMMESFDFEQYSIEIQGVIKFCDKEVFVILSTLYQMGITNIQDRSIACGDVFRWILSRPCEVLSKSIIESEISKYDPINYWASEIINGVKICVFNMPSHVLLWETLCDYKGFYKKAIELGKEVIERECHNDNEVEEFLKPLRIEAKKDEDFKSKINKKGANKYLLPMLYYLKDSNPEVLDAEEEFV